MAVSASTLTQALGAIVGREHLGTDPVALSRLAVDGVVPRWAARPGSADEVSRLLALATAERLAVAPRGSGGAVALGNPPARLDLVIDCQRLNAIIDYVPEDMVTTAGAGICLDALAACLTARRQRFPVDPIGGSGRSVGGVLATHASGPLRFRYGSGRDLLLGVRFVQADGTVTWGGARVVKSVTGYDVPKLLVGSLGTLGIIVEATLRLHPVPPASASWLIPFPSHERASAFLAEMLASTLQPDRVVLLNEQALRAMAHEPSRAAVVVSISSVAEAVAGQGEALSLLAGRQGARSVPVGEQFWVGLGQAVAGPVALKLGGEPRRLGFWLGELERIAAELGATVSAVGEAGSGVLQAALPARLPAAGWDRDLLGPLRSALGEEAGSLVVERAPLELKKGVDVWGPIPEETLAIMRRLKTEFDPLGVLNPGRFVGGL